MVDGALEGRKAGRQPSLLWRLEEEGSQELGVLKRQDNEQHILLWESTWKHVEINGDPRGSHEILPGFPVGLQSSPRSFIKAESQGDIMFLRY